MALPVLFAQAIGGVLVSVAGNVVSRVLVALGIGVVTYTGMNFTLDWLKGQVVANIQSLPPEVIGMLSTMKVGNCISVILSAMLIRLSLNGMTGDSFKRWVKK